MRRVTAPILLTVLGVIAGVPSIHAEGPKRPLGLDVYRPVPDANPLTPAKVDLGRRLFRDRRLSRDGSKACASCHDPRRAFTNGEQVGQGVGGVRGTRNVPTIVNRAWGRSFFWDGRAPTLEDQVLLPILHPDELAMTVPLVVALAQSERYRPRFADAFGQSPALPIASRPNPADANDPYAGVNAADAIALRRVALALAAYVRTIQAGDSSYDRYINGDRSALSASARRGLEIFRGKGGCTGCHVGPTFSDEEFHNTGVAWRTGVLTDEGRGRVTKAAADRGAFKTPTLREVARTAPYMHDGSFATLASVVDFYDRGGAANPGLDRDIRPLKLTPGDKEDLVAFLKALTGKTRDGG
jgi:cytochrome c peroxidase